MCTPCEIITTLTIHWKDRCWSWSSNTLATWREELTHWKRPWCWERLKAGGEGDDRGWDGWMASLPRWTWVWVNSGRWWWTGSPGVPRDSRGRKESDMTELLKCTELMVWRFNFLCCVSLGMYFILQASSGSTVKRRELIMYTWRRAWQHSPVLFRLPSWC